MASTAPQPVHLVPQYTSITIDSDPNEQKADFVFAYFALGLLLGLLLGPFAFLFVCCKDTLGLRERRKSRFVIGATLGAFLFLVLLVVLFFMYVDELDFL